MQRGPRLGEGTTQMLDNASRELEGAESGPSDPEEEEPAEKFFINAAAFHALERRVVRLEGLHDRDGLDVWLAEGGQMQEIKEAVVTELAQCQA